MGTIRSEYSIEQFEEALQRFCHGQEKFLRVVTKRYTIEFRYDDEGKVKRVSVRYHEPSEYGYWPKEFWWFTVEPKLYVDSSHVSKITIESYGSDDKVEEWIQRLMEGYGIKPAQRFSLKQHAKKSNRKLTDYKAFQKG